jgi:hypothetical protein
MDKTFVMVPAKLLRDVAEAKISSSAFQVYCYVLFRRGTKDKFWGSVKDICWGTGFEEAQVSRLLKQLVEAGHIRRVKHVGRSWDTHCLTCVDDHKVIYRGRPVDCILMDAATDVDTGTKAFASNGQKIPHRKVQSKQTARDDEISEAVRLFEKEVCRQQAQSDSTPTRIRDNQATTLHGTISPTISFTNIRSLLIEDFTSKSIASICASR